MKKIVLALLVLLLTVPQLTLADVLTGQPILTAYPQAGDTLLLGYYEQDNYYGDGRERIEWTVLSVNRSAGTMLVITSKAIECMPYHATRTVVRWRDTDLHRWLNYDFYYGAFSDAERACIEPMLVDRAYECVSMLDANQIRAYGLATGCEVTDYAAYRYDGYCVQIGTDNGLGCWWVRTSSSRQGGWVPFVGIHGDIYQTNYTTTSDNGVRPVLTLRIADVMAAAHGDDLTVLTGEVYDDLYFRTIGGATVTVNGQRVRTDRYGRYTLQLEPGTYTVRVECAGYGSREETVTLVTGETYEWNVGLRRAGY